MTPPMVGIATALFLSAASIVTPAHAQSHCTAIRDPTARLACYDRAGGATPPAAPRPVQTQENCTVSAPCIGPRGGVYYITPSGTRRYIRRD